jgi:hypothetical protein
VDDGRTRTTVVRLDGDFRVEELSRMLGGSGITDGIRASAREMLQSRQAKGESKVKGESESAPGRKAKTARPARQRS